jgi:transposase
MPTPQLFLLPPCLEDFVPSDGPARVLAEILNTMDMSALELRCFRRGAPAYPPRMLFRVLMFAYADGLRSSRRIETATRNDMRYMWLSEMTPLDHVTLCRFRRNNEAAFRQLFRETVKLCHGAGLVLLEEAAADGTKLQANVSGKNTYGKKRLAEDEARLDAVIQGILDEAEEADLLSEATDGRCDGAQVLEDLRDPVRRQEKLEQLRKENEERRRAAAAAKSSEGLEQQADAQPESTHEPLTQATGQTPVPITQSQRYKRYVEAATSPQSPEQQADTQPGGDCEDLEGVLIPEELQAAVASKKKLKAVRKQMEESGRATVAATDPESRVMPVDGRKRPAFNAQAVVDGACQVIIAAEVVSDETDNHQFAPMLKQAIENVGEAPKKTVADTGFWSQDSLQFAKDHLPDTYIRESDQYKDVHAGFTYNAEQDTYTAEDSRVLKFWTEREDGGRHYRIYRARGKPKKEIWVRQDGELTLAMREKMATPEGQEIYNRRRAIIEPVFGHMKVAYGLRRLLLRGLSGASIEFHLACIAHNMGKLRLYGPAPSTQTAAAR